MIRNDMELFDNLESYSEEEVKAYCREHKIPLRLESEDTDACICKGDE